MSDMQIEIYEKKVGLLNWNFDELNTQLEEALQKYKGLQFTDEQIPEAKKTRSNLNGLKKAINDRKIEIKKEFCGPYDTFADQVKILTSKIGDVSDEIDAQIKDYEARIKEEKRKRITDWWNEHRHSSYVGIEKVWDERYLNATCKDTQWQKDLTDKNTQIKRDLDLLMVQSPDNPMQKIDFTVPKYLECLDYEKTLGAWAVHVQEQERLAKLKAEREAEKLRKEEEARQMVEGIKQEPKKLVFEEVRPEEEPVLMRTMHVWGTRQQIIDLADYMKANGIKFKKAV